MSVSEDFFSLITSSEQCEAFRLFLEKRHCEENLLFWIDAQQFRFTHSSVSPDTLNAQAHMIYKKYFEETSQFYLNVDASHTKNVRSALDTNRVTRSIFEEAQHACLILLKNDSVPKFLKSKDYTAASSEDVANKKRKKSDRRSMKILLDLKGALGDEMMSRITEVDIEKEAIVEFIAPNIDEMCAKIEQQVEDEKDWIKQVESVMCVAGNILQIQAKKNDFERGEIIYQNATNEDIWAKQIETLSLVLATQNCRNINGLLSLLGRKWLSWNSVAVTQLAKLLPNMPDCTVQFATETPVYQTSLMQLYETIRLIIEQYPDEFEYTTNFIVLLTKITCPKLPGVSFIPLFDEHDDEIEIPEFPTLKFFDEFVHRIPVFVNPSFDKGTPEKKRLLFPSWDEDQFTMSNLAYEHWNSSISSYLLQELLRVDQEVQKLSELLNKMQTVSQNNLLCYEEFKIFVDSLEEVTDTVVVKESPLLSPISPTGRQRRRTKTASVLSMGENINPLRKSKSKNIIK